MRAAHKFAMANDHITSVMVEVSEFPDIASRYQVQGVPMTVINETTKVMGAVPEPEFAQKVLEAIGKA